MEAIDVDSGAGENLGMRTIYEDEGIKVLFAQGGRAETWVSFSSLGSPVPAAKGFIEARGASGVFVIDNTEGWYSPERMAPIVEIASLFLSGKIVTFGGSMGGYAALRYASAFCADVVIAGGPQVLLDGLVDNRWLSQWADLKDRDARVGLRKEAFTAVLYDPAYIEDAVHAAILPEWVRRIPIQNAGHEVFRAVIEAGLWPALERAIVAREDAAIDSVMARYSDHHATSLDVSIDTKSHLALGVTE